MEVKNGALQFLEHEQERYYTWVKTLGTSVSDKTVFELSLQKRKHPKTNAQLGYYHAVLLPFAVQELINTGYYDLFEMSVCGFDVGIQTSDETVDMLFKTMFRAHKQAKDIPLKRNMSDEEMSEFIDFVVRFLAVNLNANAPPPKEK